ncbi:hypothetical protein GYMLUDRAFT_423221 [Collybiopsis luxurians FD-317 M1]|uniref:ENTH domain-containing protein n=1 Tax=Collybiopsis luxurians FD-317 M1 TaxID=944289 RepID=A0A0D0CLP2_9AGAR|nr:hypothetical protein GYMLUDRAFT_423221 [Collybiopsis luxurians FD-317 M1]
MQHLGKAALRVTKNYTKGYSDTQAKVREATSNDPWGPSGTQMNEIAQLTYNQGDFVEIMEMLDKRLNDKGKNWRHVFKSLTVLDYCLHQGSENVVIYFRDNIYVIKTLKEFQYVDEDGKDQGANVRQKAKDITNLLQDEARLRQERRARANMRDRMVRGAAGDGDEEPENENDQRRALGSSKRNRDEDDLRRAIEESKKSLAQERLTAEERDLQQALKLSQEEEDKRNKAVEDSNASALFDDNNQLVPANHQVNNNPFPTMTNMSDPMAYTVGLQPQFTQIQPQFTSFNPYQQQMQQQMQQEAAQQEYLRQQQEFFQQQQAAQQAQLQQEEYMRQQMLLQQQQQQQHLNLFAQQQPLMAQPTGFGSNNPFARSVSSPTNQSAIQNNPPQFNLQGTYENHLSDNHQNLSNPPSAFSQSPSPGPGPQQGGRQFAVKTRADENQQLASLFADREGGQDTFGNIGQLRYGHTNAGRLISQPTANSGHNPFAMQQQQQQQNNEQPFFSV